MIQRVMRSAFGIVLALALTLTACATSPESTVSGFYYALSEGEVTEAQSYLSSQLVGMVGEEKMSAGLAQEAERIQACGGIKDVDVELEGEGEIRTGTATITYEGDCPSKTENIKLLMEDGKWKLGATK